MPTKNITIPHEVKNYLNQGKRRLVDITVDADYTLLLTFDDGERRLYHLANKLTGVLTVLKNERKFNEVFIDSLGNIAWDINNDVDSEVVYTNRIDLSADNAYIYGVKI